MGEPLRRSTVYGQANEICLADVVFVSEEKSHRNLGECISTVSFGAGPAVQNSK